MGGKGLMLGVIYCSQFYFFYSSNILVCVHIAHSYLCVWESMCNDMGVVGKGQLADACLLLLQDVFQKSNVGCRSWQGKKKGLYSRSTMKALHLRFVKERVSQ